MSDSVRTIRQLAAVIAALVAFDVIWVKAPFLAFLGIPFVLVAWRYREGRTVTNVAIVGWCVLYTLIGISFALNNGLHPAEPNELPRLINPGDFAEVYIGTPLAVWLATTVARRAAHRRRVAQAAA